MTLSDELDAILKDKFTIIGEVNGKVKRFLCGCYGTQVEKPEPADWSFPVGNAEFPPGKWYAASMHSLDGSLNEGYKHSGYDINLDISPRGDIERTLGLAVYAVADGDITYITDDWSGVPMLVLMVEHAGSWLWVRYGHIVPAVRRGDHVKSGDVLGTFANWRSGDHLHFDMNTAAITTEWLTGSGSWLDPRLVLECYLSPMIVQAMVRKGD